MVHCVVCRSYYRYCYTGFTFNEFLFFFVPFMCTCVNIAHQLLRHDE